MASGRELVVPTGAPQLLVNLNADLLEQWDGPEFDRHATARGAVLVGPRSVPEVLDPAGQRRITGVALRAGAAPLFTGLYAAETEGRMVEIEVFAPRERLRERMLDASNSEDIFAIWERFLSRRLAGAPDPALSWALQELERGARVGEVAAELRWSMPRLRTAFAAAVGLSPKRWARVRRVQRVLKALEAGTCRSWVELAFAAGYADQAHLTREFREITGVTPGAYRPRRPGETNHISLE